MNLFASVWYSHGRTLPVHLVESILGDIDAPRLRLLDDLQTSEGPGQLGVGLIVGLQPLHPHPLLQLPINEMC